MDVTPIPKPEPRTGPKRWQRYAAELDTMRPLIRRRSGGRCEVRIPGICTGKAATVHHRVPRGVGGLNTMENLLDVCGDGTRGCHGYIEHNRREAYLCGWLVHSTEDPARVPVCTDVGGPGR